MEAPSQDWLRNIEAPATVSSRKERGKFLEQVRRRGSIFKRKQFWLDNLDPVPIQGSTSFLQQIKRRGNEAIIKVKDIGVIWGGSLVLQTVIGR